MCNFKCDTSHMTGAIKCNYISDTNNETGKHLWATVVLPSVITTHSFLKTYHKENILPMSPINITFQDFRFPSTKHSKIVWPLRMGPTGCPETSGNYYQHMLHDNPEELRSQIENCNFVQNSDVWTFHINHLYASDTTSLFTDTTNNFRPHISLAKHTLSFTAVTGYYTTYSNCAKTFSTPYMKKCRTNMDSCLCQPSTLLQKHKTYEQLFQIKLETYCSLIRMVTPHKKLLKAQHG